MMYPRLMLARELLAADGVIMLHIDEHEGPRLFLLLEEIFGAENHLGDIVWDKRNPKGDCGGVSSQHELILVFARDRATLLGGDSRGLRRQQELRRRRSSTWPPGSGPRSGVGRSPRTSGRPWPGTRSRRRHSTGTRCW